MVIVVVLFLQLLLNKRYTLYIKLLLVEGISAWCFCLGNVIIRGHFGALASVKRVANNKCPYSKICQMRSRNSNAPSLEMFPRSDNNTKSKCNNKSHQKRREARHLATTFNPTKTGGTPRNDNSKHNKCNNISPEQAGSPASGITNCNDKCFLILEIEACSPH